MSYCVRCDQPVEKTGAGACKHCGGLTVVSPFLDDFPTNWKPGANFSSDASGFLHDYLSISVAVHPSESDHNPYTDTVAAEVKWPNHVGHHREWIRPETKLVLDERAKTWLFDVLSGVDEHYDPADISSIGAAFGGAVDAETRASPTVSDADLQCGVCGAYLPHYRGDDPEGWYRSHVEYVSDGEHPPPEEPGRAGVDGAFDGRCLHCEQKPGSEQDLIDHLGEHGYSRSDRPGIARRLR